MTQFEQGIKIVDSACKKLGIKYAFISGTALGIARNGCCIEGDPDIDFCIHADDRSRVSELHEAMGIAQLSECRFNERLENVGWGFGTGNMEWVELNLLHTRGDKVWYSSRHSPDEWVSHVLPKYMWDNLEYIKAYGIYCPVFCPVDEYLETVYGKDWTIPDPTYYQREPKRVTKARCFDWDVAED